MKNILNILSDTVHNLQAERGVSALFLGSAGKKYSKKIWSQFRSTDKNIHILKDHIPLWKQKGLLEAETLSTLLSLISTLDNIKNIRQQTQSQFLAPASMIRFYSHHLILPLIQVITRISLLIDDHHPSAVNAYSCFLQWKERVGLERAIASKGFISHDFSSEDFLDRILFLISEQNSFKENFLSLATLEQQALVNSIYQNPKVQKLHHIHGDLESFRKSNLLKNMSVTEWFDIATAKINALAKIEKELIDTLDGYHRLSTTEESSSLSIDNLSNLVTTIPLFNGLSSQEISEITQYAKVFHVPKNKIIFIENGTPTHLHIVLNGGVKVFKNMKDGKATVLHILGKNECILGQSIFLDIPFDATAQAITDTILFSLPATIINKYIRNTPHIALNFLTHMAQHTQRLEKQLEFIKLKSANEKVRYFLSDLIQKQGCQVTEVKLPYKKSIMASYLGMSKETLSRSFSTLKKDGFRISKDTITLPHLFALCKTCSNDMDQHCLEKEKTALRHKAYAK